MPLAVSPRCCAFSLALALGAASLLVPVRALQPGADPFLRLVSPTAGYLVVLDRRAFARTPLLDDFVPSFAGDEDLFSHPDADSNRRLAFAGTVADFPAWDLALAEGSFEVHPFAPAADGFFSGTGRVLAYLDRSPAGPGAFPAFFNVAAAGSLSVIGSLPARAGGASPRGPLLALALSTVPPGSAGWFALDLDAEAGAVLLGQPLVASPRGDSASLSAVRVAGWFVPGASPRLDLVVVFSAPAEARLAADRLAATVSLLAADPDAVPVVSVEVAASRLHVGIESSRRLDLLLTPRP